jgi:hypothetical protein
VECDAKKSGTTIPLDELDTWGGFLDGVPGGVPQYIRHRGPDAGKAFDTSAQVAIAPIWDICNYPGFLPFCDFPKGCPPDAIVEVVGFAIIFIPGPPETHGQDDVDAILINVTGCDLSGPVDQTGPMTIPIRLVRTE